MMLRYFDSAATTRVDREVLQIADEYSRDCFYNPSANYMPSVKIHNEISEVRKEILALLKGYQGSLYFPQLR